MELTMEQIRTLLVSVGARQEQGKLVPFRFTDEQRTGYEPGTVKYIRTNCDAGICLDFITDTQELTIGLTDIWTEDGMGEYFVELLENGVYEQRQGQTVLRTQYAHLPDCEYTFHLHAGEKRVTVYLPGHWHSAITRVALTDGASMRPYAAKYTMLCFGDSITEGFCSEYNSMTYPNQLARILDARMYNFGIGTEMIRPEIVSEGPYPQCDLVTVAYGTNNFRTDTCEELGPKLRGLLDHLVRAFPGKPIFLLLPVWRFIAELVMPIGTLRDLSAFMASVAAEYENVYPIDCYNFIPHTRDAFKDGLHPNMLGCTFYAYEAARAISAILEKL